MITRNDLKNIMKQYNNNINSKLDSKANLLHNHNDDEAIGMDKFGDIEIKGRTLVNLLGRTGNAIYKQAFPVANQGEIAYEMDKFVLTNSTVNPTYARFGLLSSSSILRIGNFIALINTDSKYNCCLVTDSFKTTPNFKVSGNNRAVLFKTDGTEKYVHLNFSLNVPGDSVKCSYVRLYKLTDEEYLEADALSVDELAHKYPYVDDVKCVVNPYMETKENLLEYTSSWYKASITSSNSGGMVITPSDTYYAYTSSTKIAVKEGEILTLSKKYRDNVILGGINLYIHDIENTKYEIVATSGEINDITFTVPYDGFLVPHIVCADKTNVSSISQLYTNIVSNEYEFTLVKGSTPKIYEECNNSRIMFETKLYNGEIISKSNDGTYIKNSEWEEFIIKDISPSIGATSSGKKDVVIYNVDHLSHLTSASVTRYLVDYSGSLVPVCYYNSGAKYFVIQDIPNSLTGWGDNYTPTTDEIKAFFLGWKKRDDLSNVWAKLWCGIGEPSMWGDTKVVSSSSVTTCPTVMNNMGYTPYRLIYKKETTSVEEIKTYGSLVVKEGVNVNVNSGLVLEESVVPYVSNVGYEINPLSVQTKGHGHSCANYRFERLLNVFDGNHKIMPYITRELAALGVDYYLVNGGKVNAYATGKLTTDNIIYDYLIYTSDTVTSYDYTINTDNNILGVINKGNDELVTTKDELAKTKKELERTKIELSQRSNPNLLINGDFQIWQRGESFDCVAYHAKYVMDRWFSYSYFKDTPSKVPGTLSKLGTNGFKYSTSATANRVVFVAQKLEDNSPFLGKILTLSLKVKNVTGYAELMISRSTNNTAVSSVSTITKVDKPGVFKVTLKVPNELVGLITSVIQLNNCSSIEVEWVKLELGEYATPFVPKSYAEELVMCQRYYQRIGTTDSIASSVEVTQISSYISLQPNLRINSATLQGGTFYYKQISPTQGTYTPVNISNVTVTPVDYQVKIAIAGSFTKGNIYAITHSAFLDAEIY